MRYSLPIKQHKSAGFTLIEILIIAPIVVLMIGAFVGLMVSMVGDVLSTRDQSALTYDTQSALDRIEQDTRLSTQFLLTSGTLTAPQGADSNFTGTSAFTNDTSLVFSELATDKNPTDIGRGLVYYANQPNPCGTTQRFNHVMLTKVVYFIKSGSLWRRTIVPDFNVSPPVPDTNTTCAAPWQKDSCSPGYSASQCGTNDEEILKNLSSMDVLYYGDPGNTTPIGAANALNASTIGVTLTTSKAVAGRTVSNTSSTRASKLNSIDTTLLAPSAPTVSDTTPTPNSVQFSWTSSATATSYQVAYQINGGTWTTQTLDANTVSFTISAERNDIISFKVAAFNAAGGSSYDTDSVTLPAWTNLDLQHGWNSYSLVGGTYSIPAYTRTSTGRVFLRGLIKDGTATSGTVIANLPPGYRPIARLVFPVATSPNNSARVDVATNGDVIFYAGNNTWTSLDNISFMPDSSLLPSNQQYTWRDLAPTLNGWTNWADNDPTYEKVHATIDSVGRVNMQGLARAGTTTSNTGITTTGPAANAANYFPPETLHFMAGGNGFSDFWISYADGEVTKRGAQTSSYMGLNAMWYPGTKTGTSPWATLTLATTPTPKWVSYDNGVNYPNPQYTKGADGVVTVRGLIKSGVVTGGTLIATLPPGYRPSPTTNLFVVPSNDDYGRVDVGPDGKIIIRAADAAWLTLNFSFVADQ